MRVRDASSELASSRLSLRRSLRTLVGAAHCYKENGANERARKRASESSIQSRGEGHQRAERRLNFCPQCA
eukprot:5906792-Pleurochrysis_carterae.AAC.1